MTSPFLISEGSLSLGFSTMIVSPDSFFDQPPQPPMVTFTSF
jgi:hypothetical protein